MKHLILTVLALLTFASPAVAGDKGKESTYDRVIRTRTLHCAYYLFEPMSWIDPNTKELKGMVVDLWGAIGKNMGITVEWTEETAFGVMYEGLKAHRYDAICTPDWPNSTTAQVGAFSSPLFYSALYVYVRSDDNRFTEQNWKALLNSPDVRIATMDGSVEQHIADARFPKAKQVAIPQAAEATQIELNVMTKKADVAFIDANRAKLFLAKNPNSLKRVSDEPVQIYPFKFSVLADDFRFKNHLDIAVEEILNNGTMDAILDKYDPDKNLFLRVAKPYDAPAQ